jgi:uncharacterized RDD family membrane protein YckC
LLALALDSIALVVIAISWLVISRLSDVAWIDTWVALLIGISIVLFLIGTITRQKHRNGQSLGKQVAGLRIIREDNNPVRSGTVVIREAVCKWAPLGICLYGLSVGSEQSYWWLYLTIPVLMLVFTIFADRRSPHDVLARTRVMLEGVGRK